MVGGHNWDLYNSTFKSRQQWLTPTMFSSLSMAREHFVLNWHRCSFLLHELHKKQSPPDFPELFAAWQQTSLKIVGAWNTAFDSFLDMHEDKLSENEKRG